jgi:hypothetical protein
VPDFHYSRRGSVSSTTFASKEPVLSNIEFDIEWTDEALRKIQQIFGLKGKTGKDAELPQIALPPIECLPAEGDVLFLGPQDKRAPFVVVERQYHHEGGPDWTIVLILDLPDGD